MEINFNEENVYEVMDELMMKTDDVYASTCVGRDTSIILSNIKDKIGILEIFFPDFFYIKKIKLHYEEKEEVFRSKKYPMIKILRKFKNGEERLDVKYDVKKIEEMDMDNRRKREGEMCKYVVRDVANMIMEYNEHDIYFMKRDCIIRYKK